LTAQSGIPPPNECYRHILTKVLGRAVGRENHVNQFTLASTGDEMGDGRLGAVTYDAIGARMACIRDLCVVR